MTPDEVIALVRDVVPGLTESTERATGRLWRIASNGAGFTGATVRLGGRWIGVETALHGNAASDPLRVLRMQSALPGNVRIVRRRGHLGLRADIPVLDASTPARDWLRRQVALACAGLGATGQRENDVCREGDQTGFDPHGVAERCCAGGWRASACREAAVHVEFTSRGAHRVAVLSEYARAIRVAVTLETGAPARQGEESRAAVAAFLLRATRSLRWVRAFEAAGDEVPAAVGFECLLAVPADDQPLVMALDAVASACELYGREAEVLAEDPALARRYLALERDAGGQSAIGPSDSIPVAAVSGPGVVEIANA